MSTPHHPSGGAVARARLLDDVRRARRYDIGFPGACDITYPDLAEWLTGQLLNNVGDPGDPGHGRNHTKALERQVVGIIADLFRAPAGRWGYVTSGASEGTEHALDEAWQQFPDLVVYTSEAAHYSVFKAAAKLKLPTVMVRAQTRGGAIDLDDLAGELRLRRHRPAMIVATVGTTMTESVDDVAAINTLCDDLAIARRYIHVDAALSGVPLALLPEPDRPVGFDFTAGATSIVVSGHKFLSTLEPCGVLVYPQPPRGRRRIPYTGSVDSTLLGSRSGHTTLRLHVALTDHTLDDHRRRAQHSRTLASYAVQHLTAIGWPAWSHPHAFTVVLDSPPATVTDKWVLADDGHQAHLITMPGITADQIDEFVTDLDTALRAPAVIPRQPARALHDPGLLTAATVAP